MARVVWFDIPVGDMGRAVAFYEALTGEALVRLPVGADKETALFPAQEGGSAGCLFLAPEDHPSHSGSRVYFDAGPDLQAWVGRAEEAGGRVLVPPTEIGGGRGVFAYVEDTEGNRVGLTAPA
ncbi:VOC family protein [Arthrobacter sp. NEB 688]|uniref:VOC family protein n=1 Tax=Arthrobacter sp. NEB 688 TaxID=904039 RepID=UPI001564BE0D|nr:VOC family protein [Arthrobacter sp. NEB 688]QKE83921.1 VOC family protein [Arthrobacter sp. NEB 688]